MRRAAAPGLLALAVLLMAADAPAHTRSLSYASWQLTATDARVQARVSRLDLTRLGLDPERSREDSEAVGQLLARQLRLSAGAEPCAPVAAPTRLSAPEGWAAYGWRVACPAPSAGGRRLTSELLLEVAPDHLHFARVVLPDGELLDRVLSEAEPSWELPAADSGAGAAPARAAGSSLARYVALGIEHILTGWDHLAFVLALLLLADTWRELAVLVTAFTLAHSVTLALATLGVVHPDPAGVEALIGFSIALVAAENVWLLAGRERWIPRATAGSLVVFAVWGGGAVTRAALLGLALFSACHFAWIRLSAQPRRLRAAVAFAFGLVHGFGFAGVLEELSLPRDRLVAALFGFNAGVEVGQLAVVAFCWPLLRGLARSARPERARELAELGSAAICGLGVFWFVSRALG